MGNFLVDPVLVPRLAGRVVLWVEDSGPGIPRAKAESIFAPYTQLGPHDKGTGIGLGERQKGLGPFIRKIIKYKLLPAP